MTKQTMAERTTRINDMPVEIREGFYNGIAIDGKWVAQQNDVIGGWCVVIEDGDKTLAEGALLIADLMTEALAKYVATLHNNTRLRKGESPE